MNQSIQDKVRQHFSDHDSKTYAKNHILIFPGADSPKVFLLEGGLVEQYDITPEGNKLVVNVYKAPAFFPMSVAINDTANSYFFAAATDVVIKEADAKETVEFVKKNPDVLYDLLSRVYKGTDGLLRRLVLATSGIASRRLIYEILIEAYRFGEESATDKRTITVKQSVLASRSGLARETVSRELQKLEQEGMLTRDGKTIEVAMDKLEQKLDLTV